MPTLVFERLVNQLSDCGVPAFCFCGVGEPLLHPQWFDFATLLKGRNPGAKLYCYTNGWDLGGRTGQRLASSPLTGILISVHAYDLETRARIMRLPGPSNVLRDIDALLEVIRVNGSSLEVRIGQVEVAGTPRDERLATWCAERGLAFDSWPAWNRGGHISSRSDSHWSNVSPDGCAHFANTIFIDHRGMVLSCCCDAASETGRYNVCETPFKQVLEDRLKALSSGRPLTHLCERCDTPLSNRPFLPTRFYALALNASQRSSSHQANGESS